MRAGTGGCVALLVLASCSSFDPRTGPIRVDQLESSDAGTDTDADDEIPDGGISFRLQIRPLLNNGPKDKPRGCKSCHYATEPSHNGIDLGGLDMTTLGSLREGGGSSGRLIIKPGKPKESVIIQSLLGSYPYGGRMPKGGDAWDEASIKLMSDWIAQGAKGADDE